MKEDKERTIAIPYYPQINDYRSRPKGFICPICGYRGQIMNANYCPGCGQRIKLIFVSGGESSEYIPGQKDFDEREAKEDFEEKEEKEEKEDDYF